jgi:DNA-binding transcriptional LysR family regulator
MVQSAFLFGNSRMDLVRCMETFIAVATSQSLSEAGRNQNLTPSAVSKQLAALEEHFGVSLISRTTRGLNLTSAGQAFLPRAVKLVEDISETIDVVRGSSTAPRGTLTVAAPVVFGTRHVAPAIPKFLALYPEIRINLGLFDRQVDPVTSGVDVAFRMGQLRDSSFIAAKLATTRRILCASPKYLESCGSLSIPGDLEQHRCLIHTLYTVRNAWYFRRGNETCPVSVSGPINSNNSSVLHSAAKDGMGIALLGSWAVTEDLKSGTLVSLMQDWTGELTPEARDLYAIYPHSAHLSPTIRVFIDFIRQHFGTPPYWDHPQSS